MMKEILCAIFCFFVVIDALTESDIGGLPIQEEILGNNPSSAPSLTPSSSPSGCHHDLRLGDVAIVLFDTGTTTFCEPNIYYT